MADTKISDETSAGTLTGAELVPVVKGGANRRTTAQTIADLAPVADSAALDAAFGSTRGAVLYRGAAGWAKLDPGTSGHFLKTNGSGADPAWASAAGASVDSAALDAAFGSTQGGMLYRNATDWVVLAPGTSGQFLKAGGAAANLSWDTPAAGGGSGLYSPVLSGVPTSAGTGLTNWGNQGTATVADTSMGVTITQPSNASNDNWAIRYKAAPTPPYSIKALIALSAFSTTGNNDASFGWYDGTKAHLVRINHSTAAPSMIVSRYSTLSTWASNADYAGTAGATSKIMWLRLRHDGTNISFQASFTGDDNDFVTLFTIAAASGYLAGAYTNVFFGAACKGATAKVSLLSYAEGA